LTDHREPMSAATSLAELLAGHAAARPSAPALSVHGWSGTYADLDRAATDQARALLAHGLRPGERFAVVARNGWEFVALHYAASRAGVTIVPVNWRLSPGEAAAVLADADVSLVLAEREWAPLLAEADPSVPTVWLDGPPEDASDGASGSGQDYADWLRRGGTPEFCPADRAWDPDAVALLLYTTGSTGKPKGVMLTESHILAMFAEVSRLWRMGPDTRFLGLLPLFHIAGTACVVGPQFAGGEVVIVPDARDVPRVIDAARITHAGLVPTVISQLVDDPGSRAFDLSSLEVLIYGAAPSGGTLIADAMALLPGCGFTQGYGLTETCGTVSLAPFRRCGEPDDRLGTVGRATSTYEIRIVDHETLEDLPAGTDGEVWLRGPQNALGYWRRPQETEQAFLPDGWFRTGDIGVLDEDGYLYLKDRLKDMIIVGGENVYSVEVENVLLCHPDVREAAVYGVPDDRWGEVVKAVVAVAPDSGLTPQDLIDHTRARLAHYKCPRVVEFMEALPRSGSGKIVKHGLRARDRLAVAADVVPDVEFAPM
jgi:acyl-CoA synthetase (AMP-forming)/AMP-acid ligase II